MAVEVSLSSKIETERNKKATLCTKKYQNCEINDILLFCDPILLLYQSNFSDRIQFVELISSILTFFHLPCILFEKNVIGVNRHYFFQNLWGKYRYHLKKLHPTLWDISEFLTIIWNDSLIFSQYSQTIYRYIHRYLDCI